MARKYFIDLEKALAAPAGTVKQLDLGGSPKRSVVPDEVFTLTSLEELKLERLGLTELSPRIAELPRLKELSVADNLLSSLPAALCGLAKLRSLDIRKNPLTSVPDELFGMMQLTVLYHDLAAPIADSLAAIAPPRRPVAPAEVADGPGAEPVRALLAGEHPMAFYNWVNRLQETHGCHPRVRDYIVHTRDVAEVPGPYRIWGIVPAMRTLTTVRAFFGDGAASEALFPAIQVGEDHSGRALWMDLREGRVVTFVPGSRALDGRRSALDHANHERPGQMAQIFTLAGHFTIDGLFELQRSLPTLGMRTAADIGARKLNVVERRALTRIVVIATQRSPKQLRSMLKHRSESDEPLLRLFGR